ncbi:hypothetical protein R8Z50_31310 [Longispora sp. K20-0274]|uniref:hypothetical protein n=1 Tax=Longispora sp. K20-0274 TaxID=3088255 RepID=UPI00399A9851
MNLAEHLVEHDVWLTGRMLDRAAELPDDVLDRPITVSVGIVDDDPTIRRLLHNLVRSKERWGANLTGSVYVESHDETVEAMRARWAAAGPYLAAVRRIAAAGEWDTTVVDATCEPPRTVSAGGAVAHLLTFSAYRRTILVGAFEAAGVTDFGFGDPMRFADERHPDRPVD